MSKKIILSIKNGIISLVNKPDDTIVEIRDYDIPDDYEPGVSLLDDDGDRYNPIVFDEEEGPNPFDDEEPMTCLNHYRCDYCKIEWEDTWSCEVDVECPGCDRLYSPYESETIDGD